jgi:hypothetical protein
VSSQEDDLSVNEILCGKGNTWSKDLLILDSVPMWQQLSQCLLTKQRECIKDSHLLTYQMKAISFGGDQIAPPGNLVDTPEPAGVTLMSRGKG